MKGGAALLTKIWFVVNLIFVASFIAFLFADRSWRLAKHEGRSDAEEQAKGRRTILGWVSAFLFAATSAVLLLNMYVNG